jgi:hypothetical protein
VSLACFTKHFESLKRDEEGNQATRATIETQITLSQVTKHFSSLDYGTWRGLKALNVSLECILCSCIECREWKAWMT